LLGYILANVSEATWLGEVAEFSIGFKRRCVVPKEYLYHKTYKKGGLTDEDLKHNTRNLPRTLAWVCEVLLGCAAQCVFEKKEFPTCYRKAVGWEIVMGNTDYHKGKRTKIFCSYGAMIVSSLSKCYQYFASNEASNMFKMFH